MRNRLARWIRFILLVAMLTPVSVKAAPPAQDDLSAQALQLLRTMTPEEKVGQLFLFTFEGNQVDESTPINELITKYHIGGVMLLASNDNFAGGTRTLVETYRLTTQLQQSEWDASQRFAADPITGTTFRPVYIPMFIGTVQEGDGFPNDQLVLGVTTLPSAMAIGATWKPELAIEVGKVLGSELSSLGVNLYFGPSLDVLEMRQGQGTDDLGARTFGGDPYWVGEMGRAFIAGLHEGSVSRMAVIAKHFPGRGGSDRLPEDEVATVRKSLEQLKIIELAPFFSVTGNSPSLESTTDGLLVSHIRYQGFQGNIRATTRPVSFDQTALTQLMSLPEFISWRDNGGLVVSDDLGSRAVRRFFDPTERVFDSRQVARNAFLAGNDLLYADDFTANGDPDNYTTQVRVLESFSQKYREDPVFAEQVDTSVRRILTLKLRLYGSFDLTTVLPSATSLEQIGKSQQVALDVARQSVTLISPAISELDTVLPKPPEFRERIIFFTDVLPNQQCSICAEWSLLGVDSLQNTIIRLYGSGTVIQVTPERLFSYSFSDLTAFLDGTSPPENMESDLQTAEWVVVATLNPSSNRPESLALRRILSERPDLLRNKKVVVFAFNAPYYLDATDISKLTAFYGLYSKGPAFIEVAARVLFQELTPTGALPVSVSGIGYELIEATQPDPNQTIPLFLDILQPTPDPETQTPEPTTEPRFNLGDTIPLRSGVIYDKNRNPVPDGTPVRFIVTIDGESGSIQQFETVTSQGVARLSYRIDKAGLVEIRVTSEPAVNSDKLQLDIAAGQSAAITAITPTGTPSPSPTVTVTPSATITITPTPQPTPIPLRPGQPDLSEWALAMLAIFGGATLAVAASLAVKPSLAWGVRWCLITLSCGLAGYLYLSLGLPGSVNWIQAHSTGGILKLTSAGIGAGWAISLAWWLLNRIKLSQKSRK